jgi:excisionase family DNA binding protein
MASVEDLAAALGIGRNQAYALVQTKVVPSLRVGRRWLIPRAAIARMVNGESVATAAENTA